MIFVVAMQYGLLSAHSPSDLAYWARDGRVDFHVADHRRIEALLSISDDEHSETRLLSALEHLRAAASELPHNEHIDLPEFRDLDLEPVILPRDAFFGPAEQIGVNQATGRIAAEQLTPYPPGIPAVVPGERITAELGVYLRSGIAAGMATPHATESSFPRWKSLAVSTAAGLCW